MSLSAKELALFYGAKAKVIRATTKAGDEIWDGLIGKIVTINAENLVYAHSAELKPILRPLEDMSKDEAVELAKHPIGNTDLGGFIEWYYDGNYFEGFKIKKWVASSRFIPKVFKFDSLSPKRTLYVLQHGFDLFGWIDQDKAINALELEPNPYKNGN